MNLGKKSYWSCISIILLKKLQRFLGTTYACEQTDLIRRKGKRRGSQWEKYFQRHGSLSRNLFTATLASLFLKKKKQPLHHFIRGERNTITMRPWKAPNSNCHDQLILCYFCVCSRNAAIIRVVLWTLIRKRSSFCGLAKCVLHCSSFNETLDGFGIFAVLSKEITQNLSKIIRSKEWNLAQPRCEIREEMSREWTCWPYE